MSDSITKKDLVSYGILAMPLAFAGIPLYIHAPDFYATTYSVSLGTLGLVLLVLRFIDAMQDPIIGVLSNRHSINRPVIMLAAALLLAASFALLFSPLTDLYVAWFGVFTFLSTTAFSILTVNLNTLGGLWSRDKNHKTTIVSYRETFGLVGLIIAVVLPGLLQNNMGKEQSFHIVSLTLFGLVFVGIAFFWKWQKKHQHVNTSHNNENFSLKEFLYISRQTKKFFCIYGISIFASSVPAVLVLFFIRDRLNLENYTGLFLLLYFLSGASGIPIWRFLSYRLSKYKAWLGAMILAVISFIWAYFLSSGDFWQYLVICVLSGIAFGAELILPSSILADHIHENRKESQASLHFGTLAFLAKLSLALAAVLSLPFLDIIGFVPATENNVQVLHGLSLSYALIPCAIKLSSIYLLWGFEDEENFSNINNRNDHA